MNTKEKEQIAQLVDEAIEVMGGQRAVATRCDVSPATISQIKNRNWELIGDDMFRKIRMRLGGEDDTWVLVPDTFNVRILETYFNDAKQHSMMVCVSHPAGSSKTAAVKLYHRAYRRQCVYKIHCREWSLKQFLVELCKTLGIEKPRGYVSTDMLLGKVVEFFLLRAHLQPLLIIDEADKLKNSALRILIPLFNETEDKLGVVILGTDHLGEVIKRGVRYNKKGYDEIDSRLGRKYISLYGATMKDVRKICAANGIGGKQLQNQIWAECEPQEVEYDGQFVKMVKDLRRLKRIVRREQIRLAETV
jgi:DNA transposition AAA+ family ATPase